MNNNDNNEIPDDINTHKQIWGKDAAQVSYGVGATAEEEWRNTDEGQGCCPIFNSRIDEFRYGACGWNLGVSWLTASLKKHFRLYLIQYISN